MCKTLSYNKNIVASSELEQFSPSVCAFSKVIQKSDCYWVLLQVCIAPMLCKSEILMGLNNKQKSLCQMTTTNVYLVSNKTRKQTKGGSRPCGHCALCGCYGKNNKSMVPNASELLTKTKTFKLNLSLTCSDFGIYVAACVICHEQYVGQTSNKFSKRWAAQ